MATKKRPNYPDKERLRKQVVEHQQSKALAFHLFLDKRNPASVRLEAVQRAGSVDDPELFAPVMERVQDTEESDELRAAALAGLIHMVSADKHVASDVLGLLADEGTPSLVRKAALQLLHNADISSASFNALQGEYHEVLRGLLTDKDKSLQRSAIGTLALKGDELVQKHLVEGLDDPRKANVEPEVAIQYLSYNLHTDLFPTLRRVALEPPNLRSKKEALRNLAADPEAVDLLKEHLNDPAEDPEVRHICAVSLRTLKPADADLMAKRLILDPTENGDLRTALLNTLAHTAGPGVRSDGNFDSKLSALDRNSVTPGFRKMSQLYLKGPKP